MVDGESIAGAGALGQARIVNRVRIIALMEASILELEKMLKKLVKELMIYRVVVSLLSWFLIKTGNVTKAYRLLNKANMLPDVLEIFLPDELFAKSSIKMKSMGGRDQVARTAALRGWDVFERPLPEVYSAVLGEQSVVLDIGANTGYYSLLACAVSPTVEVHAFEPVPGIKNILENNFKINGLYGDRAWVNDCAVADTSGTAEFYLPAADHGLVETSASLNKGFREKHSETLEVTVTTVDEYADKHQLGSVDVIKVDVESMEHIVLEGAKETFRRFRPVIFIEVLQDADCDSLNRIVDYAEYVSLHMQPGEFTIQDAVRPGGANSNQMLWPVDRLEKLHELCREIGYRIINESRLDGILNAVTG